MAARPNHTTLPDGTQIPIADLAARLRKAEGTTRRELCIAVGLNPDDRQQYRIVTRACQKHHIATHDPRQSAAPPQPKPEAALRSARAALARELELARMERATAPPYMGGGVDW